MEGIFKKVLNFPSPLPFLRRMDEKVLTLCRIRGCLDEFSNMERISPSSDSISEYQRLATIPSDCSKRFLHYT